MLLRHAGAVMFAALVLNLRTATGGLLCPSAGGAGGFLWLRTYICGYAGIPVMSLAAAFWIPWSASGHLVPIFPMGIHDNRPGRDQLRCPHGEASPGARGRLGGHG